MKFRNQVPRKGGYTNLLMKIIGWTLATLVGIAIVAVIVLKSISNEQYKEWGTAAAYNFTGRELIIDGDFSLHIGTQIALMAKGIRFANAEHGTRPDMITADRLNLRLELLPLFRGVLDFVIEMDSPDILLETNEEGKGNWVINESALAKEPKPDQEKKTGPSGSFTLPLKPYIRNFEISDLAFAFVDKLSEKNISAEIPSLKISVDGGEVPLNLTAVYNGAPIELTGMLGRIDELHSNQQTSISLDGKLNEATLAINGILGPLAPKLNAQLALQVKADTVSTFGPFAGISIPDLKELDISMTALASEGRLTVDDIKILLNDSDLNLDIDGTVEDLINVSGVDLSLAATAADVSKLSRFVGVEVPDLGTLELKSQVVSKNKQLRLDNMDIKIAGESLDARLTAVVDDLMALTKVAENPKSYKTAGVDISIEANTASISKLAQVAGVDIPELGSLKLNGKISSAEESLKLSSLETVLKHQGMNGKVNATVADLFNISGINANGTIEIDSLSALSTLVNSELPQTDPWTLNLSATADDGAGGATLVSGKLNSKGIQTLIDATIPDIKDYKNMQANLSIDVETLATVGALMNKELPDEGPLKISTIAVSQPGEYRVDGFQLTLGDAVAQADLQYFMPGDGAGKPRLVGQMELKDFDLTKFVVSSEETVESSVDGAEIEADVKIPEEEMTPATGKKIFSSDPLAIGALHNYKVDLKVNALNLKLSRDFVVNGSVAVTLEKGLLKLGPLDLKNEAGGNGKGLIVLDASNPEAKLDVFLKFEDFVSPKLGGHVDLDVDLDGSGASLAAVMGSLNGRFIAALNDYKINQSALTRFGSGLLNQINPLRSDSTTLECAIVRFDAKDGMVDLTKKIAAQTTEVTWFGSGEINLKTEELDLEIHPKPRKALSSLTDVGLATLIHIGGTLAEPNVGIDPKDVAVKYASYSGYIATGGLSFLAEKVLNNRKANQDQCKRILSELEKELAEQP